jgi:hypothetical protein
MTRLLLAFGFVLSLSRAAAADVCVVIDESRDTLSPEDRRAVMISFSQSLQKNGIIVGDGTNCAATYTIYNVKLGESVTVYVVAPTGPMQGRASKLEELPMVYDQLAHSIVTGQPLGDHANVDRTNATSDQMVPRRIGSDDLKYVRLGYGTVTGPATIGGASFGFGWRHELDKLAIEVSLFDMTWATANDAMGNSHGALSGTFVKLSGYGYNNPLGASSFYYGAGFGYGTASMCDNAVNGGSCYIGFGLEGVASAGYEMLRSSTIRIMIQFDAQFPFYMTQAVLSSNSAIDRRWIPTFGLSIGLGWGKSNTVRVVTN